MQRTSFVVLSFALPDNRLLPIGEIKDGVPPNRVKLRDRVCKFCIAYLNLENDNLMDTTCVDILELHPFFGELSLCHSLPCKVSFVFSVV